VSEMEEKIKLVFGELKEWVNREKIVSQPELLCKIKSALKKHFSKDELEEFAKERGEPTAFFMKAVTGPVPLSIHAPHLSERGVYRGETFYFSHTVDRERVDFEKLLEKLRTFRLERSIQIVQEVLEKAGYLVMRENETLKAIKNQREMTIVFFKSVEDAHREVDDRIDEFKGKILVVPTGSRLEPFYEFYRRKANKILESNIAVWVAQVEEGTVSPFIGVFPGEKDKEVMEQFGKPRLAAMISSLWKTDGE